MLAVRLKEVCAILLCQCCLRLALDVEDRCTSQCLNQPGDFDLWLSQQEHPHTALPAQIAR